MRGAEVNEAALAAGGNARTGSEVAASMVSTKPVRQPSAGPRLSIARSAARQADKYVVPTQLLRTLRGKRWCYLRSATCEAGQLK